MGRKLTRVGAPLVVTAGVLVVAWGAHTVTATPDGATSATTPSALGSPATSTPAPSRTSVPPRASEVIDGLVRVGLTWQRLDEYASNQVAVWIESESGEYVTTLFVTSYTAHGGWRRRPENMLQWQAASNWGATATQVDIERAARPTPQSGEMVLYWDGRDAAGSPMPAGTYRFLVEGNVNWEQRQFFSGTIELGREGNRAEAAGEFVPAAASQYGEMVATVWASYKPGEDLDPSMLTAYTRGS